VHSPLHTRQKKGKGFNNHQPISVNIAAQTPPVKASSQVAQPKIELIVECQLQLVFHMNAICLLIQNNTCSIFQII
jgi:hypothetical protein